MQPLIYGISKADLEYYLEEWMLRHALDMHDSQQTLVVYLRDLPDETRDNILGMRGHSLDLSKLHAIKLAAKSLVTPAQSFSM